MLRAFFAKRKHQVWPNLRRAFREKAAETDVSVSELIDATHLAAARVVATPDAVRICSYANFRYHSGCGVPFCGCVSGWEEGSSRHDCDRGGLAARFRERRGSGRAASRAAARLSAASAW